MGFILKKISERGIFVKYIEMKKMLKELNKKWGLDFVSATSGNCCNTCGQMKTEKETEAWNKAETYLVVKWFFEGINYSGEFDKQETLFIKYNLAKKIAIHEICEDLKKALVGFYKVIEPESGKQCIKLVKVENTLSTLK